MEIQEHDPLETTCLPVFLQDFNKKERKEQRNKIYLLKQGGWSRACFFDVASDAWRVECITDDIAESPKTFLSDPGVPGPIFVSGCPSVTHRRFADLSDVTLADEDTNSILTDNANRAFQRNVAKQVTQAGGKMGN